MVGPSHLRQWVTGWLWGPAHGGAGPCWVAPQEGGLRPAHTTLPERSRSRAETWTEQLLLSSGAFLTPSESAVTGSLPGTGAVQCVTTERGPGSGEAPCCAVRASQRRWPETGREQSQQGAVQTQLRPAGKPVSCSSCFRIETQVGKLGRPSCPPACPVPSWTAALSQRRQGAVGRG